MFDDTNNHECKYLGFVRVQYVGEGVFAMIIHFAPDFINEELLIITKIYESTNTLQTYICGDTSLLESDSNALIRLAG